jgi:glucose/mannose-6-phosphate isomerase
MLDDLKMIHERDAQDALGVAEKQWQQLSHVFDVQLPQFENIQNVVFAGMGGSGWPALYLKVWPGTSLPLEVVSNYTLPDYVNDKTLVIACSYSGNTEETLSSLDDAAKRGAQRIVIASGGKLTEAAKEQNVTLYTIPGGIQPRMSSFYFFAALMQIFEPLGIVPKGSTKELAETGDWLKDQLASWRPDVPTSNNPAKQLAQELMGKSVVIYSGPKLFPAANKWKICCNENAKNVAWVNQYPELNHNEFIGWTSHPVEKPYAVVEIRSNLEHERVQKRFVVTEKLLSGKRPAPEVVVPIGDTLLQQLLWASNFGDFVTLYLALLNGINPTPVDLVERFKAELNK